MFTYVPNPDTEDNERLKIFVPYTEIQPVTSITLFQYNYVPVKTEGPFAYSHYFEMRWQVGETFINVEHDIAVWPGALKEIWDCKELWCAYDYVVSDWEHQEAELRAVHLGCTKISAEMISLLPHCWDEEVNWNVCDLHLFKQAKEVGIKPHQHFPGVINANPALLDRRKI